MRRTKGWRKPEGAIYVGRPSLWGNPWTLAELACWAETKEERAALAVRHYERDLGCLGLLSDWSRVVSDRRFGEVCDAFRSHGWTNMAEAAPFFLGGHDLACWCPLDQPCHADVLLRLANP